MYTKRWFVTIICMLIGCNSNQSNQPTKKQLAGTTAGKTKEPIATLDGNVALGFSADSKWLAIGAELVDTTTWKVVAMLEPRISDKNPKSKNHWGYTSVAFSPDSKKLALGDQDGSLRILEVPSMVKLQEVIAHGARITGIGFANDNETIITTSVDDVIRIRIWNSRTVEELFRSVDSEKMPKDDKGPMANVVGAVDVFALSPNRELFAVADVMSKIVIGSTRDGKVLHEFKGPDGDKVEMDSLAFSTDSSKLLVGVTPKVHVYNLNGEPTELQIATTANSDALYVKTINESGLISMCYVDTKSKMPVVDFYDFAQTKSLGTFFPHESRGNYWAVSPDGNYIATTGRGGPVRIWSVTESMKDLTQL
jgi:WD40 repeat protein